MQYPSRMTNPKVRSKTVKSADELRITYFEAFEYHQYQSGIIELPKPTQVLLNGFLRIQLQKTALGVILPDG
jgi:hypothetical protein